jgi:hypothetical protein
MNKMKSFFRLAVTLLMVGVNTPPSSAQHSHVSYTQVVTTIPIGAGGIVLTSSPNPSYLDQAVQFHCTVTVGPIAPTGSVTFIDGTTVLGTSPLISGVANFSTSTLTVGTHPIVAEYSGDAVYSPGSSNTDQQVVISVPLTLTMTPVTTTLNPGQSQLFTITADRSVGLQLTATALPSGAALAISDPVINNTGSLQSSTTVWTATLTTNKFQALERRQAPQNRSDKVFAGITLAMVLPLFFGRKRLPRGLMALAGCAVLLGGALSLSGCGTSGWYGHNPTNFPVTVTATSSLDGATASATSTVTIQ